jgi:hypothetical protein
MGIVHGIEHAGSALFNTLKNLAGDALNSAKSFLGINSPSKLFADHVGQSIPEGIAAGIQAHAAYATDAVTSLAGRVLGAGQLGGSLGLGLAGGGSLALPPGGGGGAPVINNHFHIAGSVLAERQLIDLVRQGNLQDAARNSSTYPPYQR